jgi:glycosyltransferase involved in cell wall biosynthesis
MTATRANVALVAQEVHFRGGMERAFAELVRRGSSRFDFTVYAWNLDPELRPLVRWHRVRVPPRPVPLRNACFFAEAGAMLARASSDLVHVLGAIVPNHTDLTAVHHCHSGFRNATGRLAPSEAPPLRRVNTGLERALAIVAERWCYRPGRCRKLAAVSSGVVSELETHYPGVPIVVTPNGVDPDHFRPDSNARLVLRARELRNGDEVIALFVGGNWDLKGLAIAIESIARARSPVPLHLWIVGRGDVDRFSELARVRGVLERVRFFGPVSDTHPFYCAADILLLPSQYETGSLVLREAAASGIPTVAVDVSGVREIIGEDEGGFVVPRSADAFATALETLATRPELRRQQAEFARRQALQWSWARSVDQVLAVYEELLNGDRP